jgi:NADH:ubiquinone oxidoreductase subunit 6 (subunit J)
MSYILVAAAILVCSLRAIRTGRLLISALWLAGASASVAVLMYMLGAPEVAVIELSVGAGLVTVLFVFAINIAGDDPLPRQPSIPKPLSWLLIVAALAVGSWLTLSQRGPTVPVPQADRFAKVVWEERTLDVLLQTVLIFGGVLGVLGLLHDRGEHMAKEEHS